MSGQNQICAKCGRPWIGIQKRCRVCGGTVARFDDKQHAVPEHAGGKPKPWHLVKCQCGYANCDRHTVEGGGVFGTFYQGCGWDKDVAQKICDILNRHWVMP